MPPKQDRQATILILDVGINEAPGENSFFEVARECAIRVIERNIMNKGKDLLGIILLGSEKTNNAKAQECAGVFEHIEILAELNTPSWKMIRDLPDAPSQHRGNWLEAVEVAADQFKNGVSGVNIIKKKIILMTSFQSSIGLKEIDSEKLINGYKKHNLELVVIGPDLNDDTQDDEEIQLAQKIVRATDGSTATFEHAISYLLFHKKNDVNVDEWSVELSIGPNIKIPISSYTRLKEEPAVTMHKTNDSKTSAASSKKGIKPKKVYRNAENQEVDADSVIKGYLYGQQIISFSQIDKSLLYDPGEESLSLYGFTDATKIDWQNFKGDGLAYVFGRKGDKKAQCAIQCLVECLHENNLVGIARRVKRKLAKMYAIMPVIDNDDYICLSMVELCYKEDIKYMPFPSTRLQRFACSDEQVDAFKDLIKSMDLMHAYDNDFDDTEAFPTAETVSPSVQYALDCIAFRAMNPGKPLPKPTDDINMILPTPPLIMKKSRGPLEKIKILFPLTEVETKTRDKKNILLHDNDETPDVKATNPISFVEMPLIQLCSSKVKNTLVKIGTMDPVNDFKSLADQGSSLSDLSAEMTEAIENLVYCNLDGTYEKPLAAMKFYRNECIKADPSLYNNWLQNFKLSLPDHKKEDFLDLINNNLLNFILKEENSSSTYENVKGHDSNVYESDIVPDATELTIDTEINDLFDEM